MAELSNTVKRGILQQNIDALDQRLYDVAVNKRVCEAVGDGKGLEAATKRYDEIDRKRRAYKEILDEIPAPPAPDGEQ